MPLLNEVMQTVGYIWEKNVYDSQFSKKTKNDRIEVCPTIDS